MLFHDVYLDIEVTMMQMLHAIFVEIVCCAKSVRGPVTPVITICI